MKNLFLDISRLAFVDMGSGLARVARGFLGNLFRYHTQHVNIKPVYARAYEQGYYIANVFCRKLGFCCTENDEDTPIIFCESDIFLGSLDAPRGSMARQIVALDAMHQQGIKIYSMVYDLLPALYPEFFREKICFDNSRLNGSHEPTQDHKDVFLEWLDTIVRYDGAVCISQKTSQDLVHWMTEHCENRLSSFDIQWIHLGSDISGTLPTLGLPPDSDALLAWMRARPTILVVSTLEPRKGHAQTLSAFNLLWKDGRDVNLLLVGGHGWGVDTTVNNILHHAEFGSRLRWKHDVSDEYLKKIYCTATALLMPSECEGFGLPIVEAASFNIPLILRDLQVFREIVGTNAFYFSGQSPEDLKAVIDRWLSEKNCGIKNENGPKLLTWKESTQQLLQCVGLL